MCSRKREGSRKSGGGSLLFFPLQPSGRHDDDRDDDSNYDDGVDGDGGGDGDLRVNEDSKLLKNSRIFPDRHDLLSLALKKYYNSCCQRPRELPPDHNTLVVAS